jgi:hypothetical protein
VLLTNESVSGTALIGIDQGGGTPITIIWQSGTCVYVTGAPAGNQGQVALGAGPVLTVTGMATNVGQHISNTQFMNVTWTT